MYHCIIHGSKFQVSNVQSLLFIYQASNVWSTILMAAVIDSLLT